MLTPSQVAEANAGCSKRYNLVNSQVALSNEGCSSTLQRETSNEAGPSVEPKITCPKVVRITKNKKVHCSKSDNVSKKNKKAECKEKRKNKKISNETRNLCIELYNTGEKKLKEIGQLLNVKLSTVYAIVKRYKDTGLIFRSTNRGHRKTKITEDMMTYIKIDCSIN
jgi:DNA-directed RNA polymerase specialized sigma subunit